MDFLIEPVSQEILNPSKTTFQVLLIESSVELIRTRESIYKFFIFAQTGDDVYPVIFFFDRKGGRGVVTFGMLPCR